MNEREGTIEGRMKYTKKFDCLVKLVDNDIDIKLPIIIV